MFNKIVNKVASIGMRRMLKSKLKNVPKEDQEKVFSAIESNPEYFNNIAKQIDDRMKQGKDQMTAALEVMRENQEELRRLMN